MDLELNGHCTKGLDCSICSPSTEISPDNLNLNVNAKLFVPKSKQGVNNATITSTGETTLKFNLEAKEFVPRDPKEEVPQVDNEVTKEVQVKVPEDEEEDDNPDDPNVEEFDMIMKDIVNNDVMEELCEEESDDEKWFPKYKECECCKGFVYKCTGSACTELGQCFCKMKDECEDDEEEE